MDLQQLFQPDMLLQVRGMTPGRAATLLPMALGLISLVIGWLALARSSYRTSSRRIMAFLALITALTAIVLGISHLARVTGDFGTGSGKLGAIVATVLGLIGVITGSLTLSRIRQVAGRT